MSALVLPRAGGVLEPYEPVAREPLPVLGAEPRSRVCFAAAHVVADPLAGGDPTGPAQLDWETTLHFRRHLWAHGLRVAEAMDTAQRGMGLDWAATQELIRRSVAEAKAVGGQLAAGAGTDQLPAGPATLDDVRRAYTEQLEFIEGEGAPVILMASRALCAAASSADDYRNIYGELLDAASAPVILHWLGDMFDPLLAGYWGSRVFEDALDVVVSIIDAHVEKVDGIKISLLDADKEIALRERLPAGVKMYTGDDFNYPQLIASGSHALLGIFDAIAPAAAAAMHALDEGDTARYDELLAPTVPLSRHIFAPPTQYYKTGVVYLAFLNGHQQHFRMVGGLESGRSVLHLAELFVLADRAGLLRDPELASERMRHVLALAGVN
ncbi:dihydrodipicolinate synthase family protein [Solirubrobacter soli]|uniref:dihydrodipicolinate synthase family protein n=1 Tax=Solirubrobacter soli TaxID=363832 RepID=UPI0004096BCF|nr:dihydrodipicolinate synthase family protein [Solirubrobacter soli]